MNPFFKSHNNLISELKELIVQERDSLRKLHCEGKIYDLYVNLLKNVTSLADIDILITLQEIETLERFIMMNHYGYKKEDHFIDYRGEYPCRTSAIILNILLRLPASNFCNKGFGYVIGSMIRNRLPILRKYPEYYHKAENLLKLHPQI